MNECTLFEDKFSKRIKAKKYENLYDFHLRDMYNISICIKLYEILISSQKAAKHKLEKPRVTRWLRNYKLLQKESRFKVCGESRILGYNDVFLVNKVA